MNQHPTFLKSSLTTLQNYTKFIEDKASKYKKRKRKQTNKQTN